MFNYTNRNENPHDDILFYFISKFKLYIIFTIILKTLYCMIDNHIKNSIIILR